jgi:hypothetical protein
MATSATTLALSLGLLLLPELSPADPGRAHHALLNAQDLSPHLGDLESAKKEARERNAPLLIHIILEGEEQNDEYRSGILPEKELVKLSKACVVIIGNNGDHPQTTITEKVDGESRKRTACSVYKMFQNCAQHRANWDPIYRNYQDDNGELGCPQTILHAPDGEIAWRHNIRNPPAVNEIIKAIKSAQKKFGKSLTPEELRSVKGHHVAATNAAKAEDWPKVWERCQEILDISELGVWAEGAKSSLADALKKMQDNLKLIEESFAPGQVAAAWRKFTAFEAATRKTSLVREVALLKKRIGKNKGLKEELAQIKAEMAAEVIEAEAEALMRKDEERKAMKLFKKILGKRYAATETAKRVRGRFPDLQ